MPKKIAVVLLLGMSLTILFAGCYKVTTLVIPNTGEEVTTPVSLSNDIIPIMNNSCNMSGCHSSGGIKPDLTTDKAYNSIINGNYTDAVNPENSQIYLWLTGKRTTAMPVGAASNPSNINQLVLAWIKQGTKNN